MSDAITSTDAIEVVRKYAIPHKDRSKPPIELQNFPIIDKNALFMHGVAALQQLLIEYDSLLLITDTFKQRAEEVKRSNEDLEKRFLNQADSQLLEQKQALIAELDYKKRELDLNSAKSEEEKKRIEVELSEEKILLVTICTVVCIADVMKQFPIAYRTTKKS